ncbi:MAG: iron ABC transporter permease [Pseudomonadota bacterium]
MDAAHGGRGRAVVAAAKRLGEARPSLLLLATTLVALLVATPILTVAVSLAQPWGPSLTHLARTTLPGVLVNTLAIGLIVGSLAIVVGVGTAWLVARCSFPGAHTFQWLLVLPLAMPAYIIAYAYADALAFAGPVQSALRAAFDWQRGDYWFPNVHSTGGAGFMLGLVLYPYVFLMARTAFSEQSGRAVDAARALGQGPWQIFWRVSLPLARPAVVAGTALVLMEALADFATVHYFGVPTFTTAIYRTWFGMGDRVAATQLATGLLVFVLALAWLEAQSRGQRRFHGSSAGGAATAGYAIGGWRAVAAWLACALPVSLGFAIPVVLLVDLQIGGGDELLGSRFLGYASNSLVLATTASVLIVGVALLLGYAVRWSRSRLLRPLVRVATIGYAVPGTVVAVGILVPLGWLDNTIDAWLRSLFGLSTGLLLSGTMVALLFAYLVRFLAVAHGAVEAGFAKIPSSLDEAARLLGVGPRQVVVRVHAPLLRRSLLIALLVVFVDVIKELPATLIIRPFDFDTLAIRVYQLAADERLSEAATGSLAIVAVGLLPVLLVTRLTATRR